MPTHAETLTRANSKKQICTINTFRKHCFAWTAAVSGVSPLVVPLAFDVSRMTENSEATVMARDTSLANLIAASTATGGRYYWDLASTTLHVKPLESAASIQEKFYIAWCVLHWSIDGELQTVPSGGSDEPFSARLLEAPPMKIADSVLYVGANDRISTGNLELSNMDGIINNWDFEPDGQIDIYGVNSIFD